MLLFPTALASHDYILKIVPTVYEDKSGKQQYSYQYTVANKVPAAAACTCALCWPKAAVRRDFLGFLSRGLS